MIMRKEIFMHKLLYTAAIPLLISSAMAMEFIDEADNSPHSSRAASPAGEKLVEEVAKLDITETKEGNSPHSSRAATPVNEEDYSQANDFSFMLTPETLLNQTHDATTTTINLRKFGLDIESGNYPVGTYSIVLGKILSMPKEQTMPVHENMTITGKGFANENEEIFFKFEVTITQGIQDSDFGFANIKLPDTEDGENRSEAGSLNEGSQLEDEEKSETSSCRDDFQVDDEEDIANTDNVDTVPDAVV